MTTRFMPPDETQIKGLLDQSEELIQKSNLVFERMSRATEAARLATNRSLVPVDLRDPQGFEDEAGDLARSPVPPIKKG